MSNPQSISDLNSKTIWLANPLAIYTGTETDAGGGVVVSGREIVELVPAGAQSQPE